MTAVGVGWCTHWQHPGVSYGRLRYGYRAAALFAGACVRTIGWEVRWVDVDEGFSAVEYNGTNARRGDGLDVLYVASHGELHSNDFRLVCHSDLWEAAALGLDGQAPRVVVFDACNLVDLNDPTWADPWVALARPRLRLVCGFASNAIVGKGAALRGGDFAESLVNDDAVAQAWLDAVVAHQPRLRRGQRAVAIGFGDSNADARDSLTATLPELVARPGMTGPVYAAEVHV